MGLAGVRTMGGKYGQGAGGLELCCYFNGATRGSSATASRAWIIVLAKMALIARIGQLFWWFAGTFSIGVPEMSRTGAEICCLPRLFS